MILRYRSVLEEKLGKLEKYRGEGIVADDDGYVIAVYQAGIVDSDLLDDDCPALLRAVLPIGGTAFVAPVYSGEAPHFEWQDRDHVLKAKEKAPPVPISTTFFLEERTEFVSAIMFARSPVVVNPPWCSATQLGLLHRPAAKVPVSLGAIPVCCEMWVEDSGAVQHRGNCAMAGPYAAPVDDGSVSQDEHV